MSVKPEGHSPLGASGAGQWMVCPGSVTYSKGVQDSESEHAAEGTAAHELAAMCLSEGVDAWTHIGDELETDQHEFTVTKEMADAVQVYLDHVRSRLHSALSIHQWVEDGFHCPEIHPYFWGTSDNAMHTDDRRLLVDDYKHGAGIVVDVKENPQLMYYACGVLEKHGLWLGVDTVELSIVQPRAFHPDGRIRTWTVSTDYLAEWLEDTLVPAMKRAEVSRDTKSGNHCRFCPARLAGCPQLRDDMEELAAMVERIEGKEDKLIGWADDELGRLLTLFDEAKMLRPSILKVAQGRMEHNRTVPGFKLAHARANREWKDGVEAKVRKKFGDKAFNEPKLKSPAQIEKLPKGKAFVQEHAFKPDAGLTVVSADDNRRAVNKSTKSMFKPVKGAK